MQITWEESDGYVYITRRFSSRSAAQAGVFALLAVEEGVVESGTIVPKPATPVPDESQLPPHAQADPEDTTDGLNCETRAVLP